MISTTVCVAECVSSGTVKGRPSRVLCVRRKRSIYSNRTVKYSITASQLCTAHHTLQYNICIDIITQQTRIHDTTYNIIINKRELTDNSYMLLTAQTEGIRVLLLLFLRIIVHSVSNNIGLSGACDPCGCNH